MMTFDAPKKKSFENIVAKGENASNEHFLLFYMPVKDGTYYGITRGERAGGRRPHSLSGAYLQN